jgi:charged multivesicular body protein 5
MLYNQTYNLDQVSFAAEGLKDAQQTVWLQSSLTSSDTFYFLSPILISKLTLDCFYAEQMTAMKTANKELKGMMKTVKLEDIDVYSTQDCFIFLLVLLPFMASDYG